ncbi:biotin--[acetyl-CoA-carboxylase] ligase [Halochromatium glycolicum]|uniref:Bifunctional ligase/repressor BirA n=1 Tax=Halochromatium glycolicum TaxID=85075 RepID=A0AAJ0XA19_9GAMM|nr:biotin--[acetyl-CoA-carboxylase] ligase [Halochromatium glycolicum]MBK1705351.1 biotin--[acetyl-CoA-carboxylase] ligase [Halochromatium glycolicum]
MSQTLSERLAQVLRLLADGEPHSGDAIAMRLGISRTAVWKLIGQARNQLGLEIEAVRGTGYRLSEPLELLEPARLSAALDPEALGRLNRLEILDSVGSTNSVLLERARSGLGAEQPVGDARGFDRGDVCLAERQTAGRGRLGRTWVSPYGRNLYLSVLWRFSLAPAELGGLSLACGVAVASALRRLGAREVGLKWPNDVHWRRRKLAGLLLEVGGESQGPSYAVVGVGVNLRLTGVDAAAIKQPWADLSQVLTTETPGTKLPSRNRAAAWLISALLAALDRYRHQGLTPFLAEWRALDAYPGAPVEILTGAQCIRGVYLGIDEQGALRLQRPEGVRSFAAGEVSLRPTPS